MNEFKNKRVLVTGSGTGIGRGVAAAFARAGADVAFHYSHSDRGAKEGVEEARALGVKAEAFKADYENVEDVRQLGRKAIEFLGGLDVLINNAGITFNSLFESVTPEQFDLLYKVNVRGSFFLTQACLPELLESKAAVVNLTSIHAYLGRQGHSVYAGTKGAIVSFTRQLAVELAPRGVRVNGIAPGVVVVDNYYVANPSYSAQRSAEGIPAGHTGEPADVAELALFLASPRARFIVGQTFVIDGGTTSWMSFDQGFRQPFTSQFGKGYVPGV